ncbi:hypothetical protein DFH28DRAFT_1217790 [Melampsora americana]|nr:hypothetical protein DFH28DRAFT_1217790 [Melampsora americana]
MMTNDPTPKPILNLITQPLPLNSRTTSSSSSIHQTNLNTFGHSSDDQSFIQSIHSFLSSNHHHHHQQQDFKLHSISLPPQNPTELYHLLDRLLLLIQSLTNQLQTSSLAQDELSSHLKISQSNLILAESTVYDLEKLIHKLQHTSPHSNPITQSKTRDRTDSEPDLGIYGRLNLFRFGKRSTLNNIKANPSTSPSPLSSPFTLSSSSSFINCSSASSQSSFTSISSIHSNLNEIEKLKHENQSLRSSLEHVNESKRQIEGELESLSIELFEEANRMVKDERMKYGVLEEEFINFKNQFTKRTDEGSDLTREIEEMKNVKDSNLTSFSTVRTENSRSTMVMSPEGTFNETRHSPQTMNLIHPRLSNGDSKLVRPMNNHIISDHRGEVQHTFSPEPDLDLSNWYRDLDKERKERSLDIEEEESRQTRWSGPERKQLTKEPSLRRDRQMSSSSSSSRDHSKTTSMKPLESSTSRSNPTITNEAEGRSRTSSTISLKPLLLNTNTPLLSRLQTDSSLKRHSSLKYEHHPRIRSPLSKQVCKRASSFNLISSNPNLNQITDLHQTQTDVDQVRYDEKLRKGSKVERIEDDSNQVDLDSLLASIVDCAKSLGFQDELNGILLNCEKG